MNNSLTVLFLTMVNLFCDLNPIFQLQNSSNETLTIKNNAKLKINFDKRSTCPMSSWLELFGDKWTLLIIRDMIVFGKKHYKDFIQSDEKISTNILADRLKKLEQIGIITKSNNPTSKNLIDYQLSPKAFEMAPILQEITNWSMVNIENVQDISFATSEKP